MITDKLEQAMAMKPEGTGFWSVNCHSSYEEAYNEAVSKLLALSVLYGDFAFVPNRIEVGQFFPLASVRSMKRSVSGFVFSSMADFAGELRELEGAFDWNMLE